jgi:MFS family permease
MNLVYAPAAYPAGVLSDRGGRMPPLVFGVILLIGADLALAAPPSLETLAAGVALWGLHMGFTQGLLATLVADAAPAALRGTAFGMFNLVGGVATLAASLVAGALWDHFGASVAFEAGAVFAALSLIGLAIARGAAPEIGAGHKNR